jgi:hypothetical protein
MTTKSYYLGLAFIVTRGLACLITVIGLGMGFVEMMPVARVLLERSVVAFTAFNMVVSAGMVLFLLYAERQLGRGVRWLLAGVVVIAVIDLAWDVVLILR